MSNQKKFKLSDEEAKYISILMSKDSSFRSLLPSRSEFYVERKELTLDHDEAELLRDYFFDRLTEVGFDENYKPNEEGVTLERLIDLLFLQEEW